MRYLLRFSGEITTKSSNTRRQFQARLARNIRAAFATNDIAADVHADWSRFYVTSDDARAADVLGRVFGIQSYSPVITRPCGSLEDAVRAGTEVFEGEVQGARFAVRARVARDGKVPPDFRARDVEHALGAALLPHAARVDLSNPEVTARIEIRDGRAHLFTLVLPGAGGLPLGVQDKAVALVSGGYDSAVAAWMVLRRGVLVDYVFCNLGGDEHLTGTMGVLEILAERWSYGARPRVHIVDFSAVTADIAGVVKPRFAQLVLKRAMLATADRIAAETHSSAIVTGDAIGQVASQTLLNLVTMNGAAERPILRPLIGTDKVDIVRWAEHIGTAERSARVAEHCALNQHHPATSARLEAVLAEEAKLDPAHLASAIESRQVTSVARPPAQEPLEIASLPAGAVVVDMRSKAAFDAWHWPGARNVPLERLTAQLDSFKLGEVVVAYCSFGAQSALLAQALRTRGVEAYTFSGGTHALMVLDVGEENVGLLRSLVTAGG